MVSPGVFSRRTLNDNWVEDRHQPEEALTATGNIHKKTPRGYETDLATIQGDRFDVLSRISRMPPRPTYATPDDGFNEKVTTHTGDFLHPQMRAGKKLLTPRLINTANAPVCPPEKRPLKGPDSGFGAGISRHAKHHEDRFFSTTHSEFFGPADRRGKVKMEPSAHAEAGFSTEREENKVTGIACGKLCGEMHRESANPGIDTRIQRAWMPGCDPALTHIHHGGAKNASPREDNHMSLPIGDTMSKIRNDLKERQGRLFRNGTNITKGSHLKQGVSVFQDD